MLSKLEKKDYKAPFKITCFSSATKATSRTYSGSFFLTNLSHNNVKALIELVARTSRKLFPRSKLSGIEIIVPHAIGVPYTDVAKKTVSVRLYRD